MIAWHPLRSQPRAGAATKSLRVYFVDVEGGQSTLFVTPEGHSLLIDTGSPGFNDRDAERIAAVVKLAGLQRIDYVLLTHYHSDHTGGVPQLVARVPVGTFIDHGPSREFTTPSTVSSWNAYQQVLATGRYRHIVAHAGDTLPISGMDVTAVTGDGKAISQPLAGAGETNPYCTVSGTPPVDTTENGMSLGVLIHFGKLRILDLGDLTRDREMLLMCPQNKIGRVDILVVSHHGLALSSSPALVDGVHARVAVMDNSEVKGDAPEVNQVLSHAPGLEALWQLHYSSKAGAANNTRPEYIANLQGEDTGYYLELTAKHDGSFSIYNPRTNLETSYGLVPGVQD
jgi:beta-lactamase superfamily II metal-dependent hydrolase